MTDAERGYDNVCRMMTPALARQKRWSNTLERVVGRTRSATSPNGFPAAVAGLLVCLIVLLAGCAGGARSVPQPEPHAMSRADRLASAARQAPATLAGHLWLAAAEAYFRDGQPQRALQAVSRIDSATRAENPVRSALLRAESALVDYQPARALSIVERLPSGLAVGHAIRAAIIKARADTALGRFSEAALARIGVDRQIAAVRARTNNEQAIWSILQRLPPRQLLIPPPQADRQARAWWSLTALAARRPGSRAYRQAIETWRRHHRHHPANHVIVPDLLSGELGQPASQLAAARWPRQPRRIALLLPLSGRFAPAGRAVAQGVDAERRQSHAKSPTIKRYDTGGSAAGARSAYRAAVAQQADVVVGPLTKPAVEALAELMSLPVPSLALNEPKAELLPLRMLVFDLSPEDAAAATAAAAHDRGWQRAAIVRADSDRGQRLAAAFSQRFRALGGEIVATVVYPPDAGARLNGIVKHFLLGPPPLWHDGRALQRIDFVFLQGPPRDARLIRPLLRFYRASRLPVYATGEVFADTAAARVNLDLDGVTVCDAPAALRTAAAGRRYRGVRLRALGADAYRLVNALSRLQRDQSASMAGQTGRLSLGSDQFVHRQLACAPFHNGRPAVSRP